MNIKFDSGLVYGDSDQYIKTKIRSYGDQINTNLVKKCQKKIHHTNVSH